MLTVWRYWARDSTLYHVSLPDRNVNYKAAILIAASEASSETNLNVSVWPGESGLFICQLQSRFGFPDICEPAVYSDSGKLFASHVSLPDSWDRVSCYNRRSLSCSWKQKLKRAIFLNYLVDRVLWSTMTQNGKLAIISFIVISCWVNVYKLKHLNGSCE